jgi:hypothetical protein
MKVREWLALSRFTHYLLPEPKSWIVALIRILSWALQTRVDGRARDVSLSKGHYGLLNTLLWSDVQTRVESGDITKLLVALTIRNSKNIRNATGVAIFLVINDLGTRAFQRIQSAS